MGKKTTKRKRDAEEVEGFSKKEARTEKPKKDLKVKWELNKYINKQRTLVFSSRAITHRDRHLLSDLRDLLPHSKKEVKFDAKGKLHLINEVCELKNCNNCVFFESKKRKDLYMWVGKTPHGPCAKFLVQNVHTMSEVKLTGNCLKGSRPLVMFDKTFDSEPHYGLLKTMFTQVFGSPKGHPKVKPFIDHILSFFIVDGRIWVRNYQLVFENPEEGDKDKDQGMVLVEIGPRFVLNPVRIFGGSFGGPTLWENPKFVSPNMLRAQLKMRKSAKYSGKVNAKATRRDYEEENAAEENEIDTVFQ